MKHLFILLLILFAAGIGFADDFDPTSNVSRGVKECVPGSNPITTRTGGEDCATATVIGSLPYEDIASTSSAADNYNYACPYSNTGGKDVVYKYTPSVNQQVTIDLCGSYYDTKVYMYASVCSGTPIACNDDYCSGPNFPSPYLSVLSRVSLTAGVTYYIVVDAYTSADYGTYDLKVQEYVDPCPVTCPAGAQQEGEPWCHNDYVDHWNGGCNSDPYVFQTLCPAPGTNTAVLCGKSGTYLHDGMDNRDTDWFLCYGIGATMTATVRTSSWPVQLFFFYGTSCPYLQGPSATGSCGGNEPTLSRFVANNAYVWIMVAPTIFSGLSCASDYILTMDGIGVGPGNDCVSTGVPERPDEQAPGRQKGSWGTIKRLYR